MTSLSLHGMVAACGSGGADSESASTMIWQLAEREPRVGSRWFCVVIMATMMCQQSGVIGDYTAIFYMNFWYHSTYHQVRGIARIPHHKM